MIYKIATGIAKALDHLHNWLQKPTPWKSPSPTTFFLIKIYIYRPPRLQFRPPLSPSSTLLHNWSKNAPSFSRIWLQGVGTYQDDQCWWKHAPASTASPRSCSSFSFPNSPPFEISRWLVAISVSFWRMDSSMPC